MSDHQQHQRWQRGDQILWTYRNSDFPHLVDQRPVTVVADDDHHLAVWMAADTRMLYQVTTDGHDLRSVSGTDRFTAPRAQAVRNWVGSGILAVFQPNTMYSVWFFETKPGLRNSYYVNIEEEFTRSDSGIVTSDLVLDVLVGPDRDCAFKDEDELELAHRAGVFSTSKVEQIRQVAQQAVEDVEHWEFPFNAGYEGFQPDPDWTVPTLPADAHWEFDDDAERD
ncbi:DUF402 domain-containing protein [Brevibacterium aurantiacum]|uniref:DUF402 domain-containing protein n=1 Tax=Brevibacterium aurantiacum TaxID=273384 RepID=A0A2A3YQ83_BREAU|nr:DUF402 domain-containing protein [Brevibacterium aurantiacum]PCC41441.1 hypothetical protein CIK65_17665 [Brevibacterium aurantiacum]